MSERRPRWIWAALAATLVATWYASGIEEDTAGADLVVPQRTPARMPSVVPVAPVDAVQGEASAMPAEPATTAAARLPAPKTALMAPRDWRPPPPPPVVVAAPPPQAPPLPFKYLGRLDEGDGRIAIFLGEGPQMLPHVVRQGDRLLQYQVDAVSNRSITLIYLPLNLKQQILFGNAS